jgi:large conductance mechanosensitive channel
MSGFKKFILRGNVVDLAVAVVIGAAFGAIVTALVKDIVTPAISLFGGLPDFGSWVITIGNAKFMIGDFLNAVITFLIMAFVVYFFIVLPVQKLMDRFKPEPQHEETQKECPYCLSKIPKQATRCAFCTSDLEETERQPAPAVVQAAPRPAGNGVNR